MKNTLPVILVILLSLAALTSQAQRTEITSLLLISKNTEFILNLEEGKKLLLSKKSGWIEVGEEKSRMWHFLKHKNDKIRKIYRDDETGQIFVQFKKMGKYRLDEMELLGNRYGKNTIIAGVLNMGAVASLSGALILTNFVTGTAHTMALAGIGISGAAFLYLATYAYLGDVYPYDLHNADILYRLEGAQGYELYRSYPEATGTFSYPEISLK